jgi:hypothetical protein
MTLILSNLILSLYLFLVFQVASLCYNSGFLTYLEKIIKVEWLVDVNKNSEFIYKSRMLYGFKTQFKVYKSGMVHWFRQIFVCTSGATHGFTVANVVSLCMGNMGHLFSVWLGNIRSK